jgi:hypothetical protein
MRNFQKYTDLMEKENEIHNSNNYDVIDNIKDITFKNKKIKCINYFSEFNHKRNQLSTLFE